MWFFCNKNHDSMIKRAYPTIFVILHCAPHHYNDKTHYINLYIKKHIGNKATHIKCSISNKVKLSPACE